MPSANADLPMLGRPATTTRLPGWRPEVMWSTSRKPVGVPVISPPDSYIFVICSKLSRTSTSMCSKLPRIRCWARSNTICSARSTSSGVSPGRSQPRRWICSPTTVRPRSVAISRTIFAWWPAFDVAGTSVAISWIRSLPPTSSSSPFSSSLSATVIASTGLAVLVEVERGAVDLRVRLAVEVARVDDVADGLDRRAPRASSRRGRTPRRRDSAAEAAPSRRREPCGRTGGRGHQGPSESGRAGRPQRCGKRDVTAREGHRLQA